MKDVQPWVEQTFAGCQPKTFFELGAHVGEDTVWLAGIPCTIVHAFEPDPRNIVSPLPNVVFNRAAISSKTGVASFRQSASYGSAWPTWTESGSLREPTGHLRRWPDVRFGDIIEVQTVALDDYVREKGIPIIDFIWADIQGCEGDMIEGGREALSRTRYLYTEVADEAYYEGQKTSTQIMKMLPEWCLMKRFDDNLLLQNMRFDNFQPPSLEWRR